MKIQLSHYEFELSDRYRAGSVLTDGEAKALNIERSDRIRNRAARFLERMAKPEGAGVLTGEPRQRLYDYVAKQDETFEFETRATLRVKIGTLEAEIRAVARERAEALARGRQRENDAELIGQLFEGLLEDPATESEAAARIEARVAATAGGLGDL